jgi:hypothetical protein
VRRHAASRRTGGQDADRRPGPAPSLESPRDAGLSVRSRYSTRARRTGPPAWLAIALTIVIIAAAGISIAAMAPRTRKANTPAAAVAAVWAAVATATPAPAAAATAAEVTPTPYFASFRGVRLHLPISADAVTVLGYHQSSYNDTYPMVSLLKAGDPGKAVALAAAEKKAGAHSAADLAGDPVQENAKGIWIGTALALWRTGVAGGRYTAIDCGASPGTPICSPVDGTVMEIRPYKLYGKYSDIEIDIKPDVWSDVDVILLHTTDPTVTEGQHVIGGVTEIAHVRHISNIVPGLQLASYSPDGGNHTHLQLTRIPDPGQPWTMGQDPPGMVRKGN